MRPVASVVTTTGEPVAMDAREKLRIAGSWLLSTVTLSEVAPDPTCRLQSTNGSTAPTADSTSPASTSGSDEYTGRLASLVVPAAEPIKSRAANEKFVGLRRI